MSIHPTAIIDSTARIGKNVSIGAYTVIGPETEIGDGGHIWPHALMEYTTLGAHCTVFPYTSLGLPPQHLKYKNEKTRLETGPNNVFRESVTVHRGTVLDQGITRIGANGYFMALSHIAHDCQIGDNVIMANGAQLAGHVKVGDNCFISTTVGVHQFVRIGTGSLISGGAMVPLDVAPYCIAQGDRAAVRGINVVGMRRMGIDRDTMKRVKEAYRVVFLSNLPLREALMQPALLVKNAAVQTFREFLLEPKRGLLRPEKRVIIDPVEEEKVEN